MDKFEEALKWIVGILREKKIDFQIAGSVAAKIYGSNRKITDVDILIREEDFDRLLPSVKQYVVKGPLQSESEMLDCLFMKLVYKGATIKFGGSERTKIFDKKANRLVNFEVNLSRYVNKTIFGIVLPLMPRDELLKYKENLGRKVDKTDIDNLI
ncbi:MAG: hypothetical protein WCK90_01845 [archaeon]